MGTFASYPVLRVGSVLRTGVDPLPPRESVSIGRCLFEARQDLSGNFRTILQETVPDVQFHGEKTLKPDSSIHFSPNVTVDFEPLEFSKNGIRYECKLLMSLCYSPSKPKIWVRLSSIDVNVTHARLAEACDNMLTWAPALKAGALCVVNRIVRESRFPVEFTPAHDFQVFMISADDKEDRLRSLFSQESDRANQATAFQILRNELCDSVGVNIPRSSGDGAIETIASYEFPRQVTEFDHSRGMEVETLDDNVYRAICAMMSGPEETSVFGLGVEPSRPASFRRSASHVASAELSIALGDRY